LKNLLAIDPGATTGLVILSIERNPKLIYHEIYKAESRTVRPSAIVKKLVELYGIESAAIEDQFLRLGKKMNPDTLKKVARRSGNWEEACLSAGLTVQWVNPRTWQSQIVGQRLGRTRDQIGEAYRMIAYQDTKTRLSADESAAWCIGRYVVEEINQEELRARNISKRTPGLACAGMDTRAET
jgi:Holliday junction resolvasome RuvABC endonuclease subunit